LDKDSTQTISKELFQVFFKTIWCNKKQIG